MDDRKRQALQYLSQDSLLHIDMLESIRWGQAVILQALPRGCFPGCNRLNYLWHIKNSIRKPCKKDWRCRIKWLAFRQCIPERSQSPSAIKAIPSVSLMNPIFLLCGSIILMRMTKNIWRNGFVPEQCSAHLLTEAWLVLSGCMRKAPWVCWKSFRPIAGGESRQPWKHFRLTGFSLRKKFRLRRLSVGIRLPSACTKSLDSPYLLFRFFGWKNSAG